MVLQELIQYLVLDTEVEIEEHSESISQLYAAAEDSDSGSDADSSGDSDSGSSGSKDTRPWCEFNIHAWGCRSMVKIINLALLGLKFDSAQDKKKPKSKKKDKKRSGKKTKKNKKEKKTKKSGKNKKKGETEKDDKGQENKDQEQTQTNAKETAKQGKKVGPCICHHPCCSPIAQPPKTSPISDARRLMLQGARSMATQRSCQSLGLIILSLTSTVALPEPSPGPAFQKKNYRSLTRNSSTAF